MAKSVNQVILMGRLTRDPELRTTNSGKSVATFGLAVDKYGQDAGADFFDIVVWDKLAELAHQYLTKGRRCLVQGRLSQQQWEQEGQKRSKIEIVAFDLTFLDGPNSGNGEAPVAPSAPASPAPQTDAVVDDEIDLSDIPF